MIRYAILCVMCSLTAVHPSTFEDDDPIKDKLDAAKAKYDEEVDRCHAKVMASLEEKQAAAQKAGSLQNVEKIQTEMKSFDADEGLPTMVSTREYKRAMTKACRTMEEDYIAARKAYVQADKIEEAKAIETELDEFKASFAADLNPDSAGVNRKLLDASRASMTENRFLYFYVCTTSLGERVLRATRRQYAHTPNGAHPEHPANPLRDVRLSAYGGEPSLGTVRQLARMCQAHNAKITPR